MARIWQSGQTVRTHRKRPSTASRRQRGAARFYGNAK
nr:MAG TPA_asm: hypothetical protein [Caudoviricetes sp.]